MSIEVAATAAEARDRVRSARRSGKTIGLVPTMGALHAGHASLIENARGENDWITVSIFVNPLQFGPHEDYDRYPRDLEADLRLCEKFSVDLVFAPEAGEMYPLPQLTTVDVARVSEHLCGASRPGHFRGVATVVLKLLNIIQPDRAYFGEKDAQQLAVIRRMIRDLNLNVTIVGIPTVREEDGLAVSSRNKYLSPEERKAAPVLYRALRSARKNIEDGERSAAAIKQAALSVLQAPRLVRVEYLEVVDVNEMQPVNEITEPVRILGAIWIGSTRLIDNVVCVQGIF